MTELPLTNTTRLREALNTHYNDDELRTLCADLGVDYDNLAGGTKQSKVRELVDYLRRRERVYDLIEVVSKQRPDVNWYKLAKPQPEQQRTPYSSSQKWLVISAVAISSVLIVILVVLLIRELFIIPTPQPTPTSISLSDTSTPQPTATPFPYWVRVMEEGTEQPLSGVMVRIMFVDQPLKGITGSSGYAMILIDTNRIGQSATLDVETSGYFPYHEPIILRRDLPTNVLLKKQAVTNPTLQPTPRDTPTAQPTSTSTVRPTPRDTPTFQPTKPVTPPNPDNGVGARILELIAQLPIVPVLMIVCGLIGFIALLFNASKLSSDNQRLVIWLMPGILVLGGFSLLLRNNPPTTKQPAQPSLSPQITIENQLALPASIYIRLVAELLSFQ
jgi:hypothetical protein